MTQTADRSMKKKKESHSAAGARRIRLPGFVTEHEVGLGDVIKRTTSALGFTPCGGCARRAATLNRWLVFTGRRSR